MISQDYRFHGHGSLNYLHRNGKVARSGHMAIKYVPNSKRDLPRFAVVVSKKVYKSAVKRNRIRRRLYEIIRRFVARKDDIKSVDVMINVYSPEVLNYDPVKLETELIGLLKQANL